MYGVYIYVKIPGINGETKLWLRAFTNSLCWYLPASYNFNVILISTDVRWVEYPILF